MNMFVPEILTADYVMVTLLKIQDDSQICPPKMKVSLTSL